MDLYSEIQMKLQEADQRIKQLAKWGRQKAQTEHDYKIELTQEVFRLKQGGHPATLIQLIAYGQPNVAKKRLDRDIADSMWQSCLESINVGKIHIRILENQLQREYGKKD